jgi:hypothetical protein
MSKVGGCNRRQRHTIDILQTCDFIPELDMDMNRAYDGLQLRDEYGINLGDKPCSMLEMMVAIALKEDALMGYYTADDCGPNTWFWEQMDNSGLSEACTDQEVYEIIDRINNREYGYYGEGGLFHVTYPREDLRNVDIWYQMQWHLAEL